MMKEKKNETPGFIEKFFRIFELGRVSSGSRVTEFGEKKIRKIHKL